MSASDASSGFARLCRLVTRLYPRTFRLEFEDEIVDTVRRTERELRRQPRRRRWGQQVRELRALVRTAMRLRFGHERDGATGSGSSAAPGGGAIPAGSTGGGAGPPRAPVAEGVRQDLRQAFRGVATNPGFSFVVVATLGLAIGASTATYSVVEAVLLRPLPYERPEELVVIWRDLLNRDVTHYPAAEADVVDYRQARTLGEVAALSMFAGPLVDGDADSERVRMGFATTNFFAVLGVGPAIGRTFTESDAQASLPAVEGESAEDGAVDGASAPLNVVLSHAFWNRRYGADPAVLGRTVQIGGSPRTIVGVAPAGFRYLAGPAADLFLDVDVWVPQQIDFSQAARNNWYLHTLARLAPGTTVAAAQAELGSIAAGQRREFPVYEAAGTHVRVVPMWEEVTGEAKPVLLALLGAVFFVLLTACVNVANLMLVRGSTRVQEVAVRAALGAGRGRLMRQMLVESCLLALLAGLVGVGLAIIGLESLVAAAPGEIARLDDVSVDGSVLAFALAMSFTAALAFGSFPALQASRPSLATAFRGHAADSREQRRTRSAMVVAEVALSLILLIGAGLMVRSFVAVRATDPGFDPEGVLSFQTTTPFTDYPSVWERSAFKEDLGGRLRALPGVVSVGSVSSLPLTGGRSAAPYGTEAMVADGDEGDFQQAHTRRVLPGYFETMGTRLLAGRLFTEDDNRAGLRRFVARRRGTLVDTASDVLGVAIVDDLFARRAWPGEEALGKRVYVKVLDPPAWFEVVGVVEHQRQRGLTGPSQQNIYFPDNALGNAANAMWVLRTDGDPYALVPQVREALRQADPGLPLAQVAALEEIVSAARSPTRFALQLIGGFALISLLLAILGLYAVLAHTVRQRAHEIGVRVALGAASTRISRMILTQGMALVGAGVLLGVLGALAMTRTMSAMLVEVSASDPVTYVVVAVLFLGIGALACYLPARRAMRVDPVTSLRGN